MATDIIADCCIQHSYRGGSCPTGQRGASARTESQVERPAGETDMHSDREEEGSKVSAPIDVPTASWSALSKTSTLVVAGLEATPATRVVAADCSVMLISSKRSDFSDNSDASCGDSRSKASISFSWLSYSASCSIIHYRYEVLLLGMLGSRDRYFTR